MAEALESKSMTKMIEKVWRWRFRARVEHARGEYKRLGQSSQAKNKHKKSPPRNLGGDRELRNCSLRRRVAPELRSLVAAIAAAALAQVIEGSLS